MGKRVKDTVKKKTRILKRKEIDAQIEQHEKNQRRGIENTLNKGGKGTRAFKAKKMQKFVDKTGGKFPPKPPKKKKSK